MRLPKVVEGGIVAKKNGVILQFQEKHYTIDKKSVFKIW